MSQNNVDTTVAMITIIMIANIVTMAEYTIISCLWSIKSDSRGR